MGLHFGEGGGIVNPRRQQQMHPSSPSRSSDPGRRFSTESHRRLIYELDDQRSPSRSYSRLAQLRHQVVDVKVLLTVEKQKEKEKRQRAECNIHVKGSDLFAESSHADLYAAVDELVDKMDRQVVRHKDRLQDHHHEAAKRELHA